MNPPRTPICDRAMLYDVDMRRAIDLYIADMQSAGRINSPRTVEGYLAVLTAHASDVRNRDPRTVGREECNATLDELAVAVRGLRFDAEHYVTIGHTGLAERPHAAPATER